MYISTNRKQHDWQQVDTESPWDLPLNRGEGQRVKRSQSLLGVAGRWGIYLSSHPSLHHLVMVQPPLWTDHRQMMFGEFQLG